MDEPYLAMIIPFGGNFAIRGWALCNGQLMSIAANQALFSLLGTTFGGDGRTTFGLPDLRGRSVVHVGHGPGLSNISWGQRSGREIVTLTTSNMPNHTHTAGTAVAVASLDNTNAINETDNGANALGSGGSMPDIFREPGGTSSALGGVSASTSVLAAGGQQYYDNRNPFLGIYMQIALVGLFPSRN